MTYHQPELPYTPDSPTSIAAAIDASVNANAQRGRIWLWLRDHGPAMFDEIADGCHMYNNSVSTRLTQMRDDGMIRHYRIPETGELLTRVTRHGSAAACYEAVPVEEWTVQTPTRRLPPAVRAIMATVREAIDLIDQDDCEGARDLLVALVGPQTQKGAPD